MLYLTVEDLKARYPRIVAQTAVTSAQLAGFVDEASGEADGYLSGAGITVPVSPAPAVLVGKVAALSYGIFLQRNVHEAGREDGIAAMMKDVRDWFAKLAAGEIQLVGADGALAAGQEFVTLWSSAETFEPTFGVRDIDEDRVDPNRIDDERSTR